MATTTAMKPDTPARCMRCETPTGLSKKEAKEMDPDGVSTEVQYCVGCRDLTPPWQIEDVVAHQHEVGAFDAEAWENAGYGVTEDGNVID